MAVNKAAAGLLGLGTLLGLAVFAGEGSKEKPHTDRDPIGPIPVPQTDDDIALIDKSICDVWIALGKPSDKAALRMAVAQTLHSDVPFPPIPADHPSVSALWELFGNRIDLFMAQPDKDAWCEGDTGIDMTEVLNEYLKQEPIGGNFYLIGSDPEVSQASDTFSSIVKRALNQAVPGAGNSANARKQYMHCVSGSPWNLDLYGSPSFSDAFPPYTSATANGLRRAWFPWNDDAVKAILERRLPKRAITQSGARIAGVGNKYGVLWLPPIDPNALQQNNIVTCGTSEWPDGSSSINPPPGLIAALGGA